MNMDGYFAKLFDTKIGQILVTLDEGKEGPEIKFQFKPQGFGVCSFSLNFNDADDAWDRAEFAFDRTDEKKATDFVFDACSSCGFTEAAVMLSGWLEA